MRWAQPTFCEQIYSLTVCHFVCWLTLGCGGKSWCSWADNRKDAIIFFLLKQWLGYVIGEQQEKKETHLPKLVFYLEVTNSFTFHFYRTFRYLPINNARVSGFNERSNIHFNCLSSRQSQINTMLRQSPKFNQMQTYLPVQTWLAEPASTNPKKN